jgi:hypothetical protein
MNDYIATYDKWWKELVENPDGTFNKDQIMRELSDYAWLMQAVSKVYCCITDGRISKPNTLPDVVIAVYEDLVTKYVDEAIEEYKNL